MPRLLAIIGMCALLLVSGGASAEVPDAEQIARDLGAQHGPVWPWRPANEFERADTFRVLREIYEQTQRSRDPREKRLALAALVEMGKFAVAEEKLILEAEPFYAGKMEGFADSSPLERIHLLQSLAHTGTPEGARFIAERLDTDEDAVPFALSLAGEIFSPMASPGTDGGYRPNWEIPLSDRKRKREWDSIRAQIIARIRSSGARRAKDDPIQKLADETLTRIEAGRVDDGRTAVAPKSLPVSSPSLSESRVAAAETLDPRTPAAPLASSRNSVAWIALGAILAGAGLYARSRRKARR